MDIQIRKITKNDYPHAKSLLGDDLWHNKIKTDYVEYFFENVNDDDNYITFIAQLDNEIVGLISAVIFLWAASKHKNMLINGFVVKNEYQNKGIGKKLLKHMEDYANTQCIIGIGLCSGYQRTSAHAFHEKNGYDKKMTQYFGKLLNPLD